MAGGKDGRAGPKMGRLLTNINWGLASGLGLVAGLAAYGLIWLLLNLLASSNAADIGYLHGLLYERGVIQPTSVTAFSILCVGLWLKKRALREQQAALGLNWLKMDHTSIDALQAAQLLQHLDEVEQDVDRRRTLAVPYRIEQALQRVRLTSSTEGVNELLDSIGDVDEMVVVNSFAPFHFIVYVIPVLGFIGTVMGVGRAIYSFGAAIAEGTAASGGAVAITGAELARISAQLGVAFDTTLLALVLAAIGILMVTARRKQEEDFLAAVDRYCVENLLNRIREDNPSIAALRQAITDMPGKITPRLESMDTNLAEIRDALGSVTGLQECATQLDQAAVALRQAVDGLNSLPGVLGDAAGDMRGAGGDLAQHAHGIEDAVARLVDAVERAGQTDGDAVDLTAPLAQIEQRLAAAGRHLEALVKLASSSAEHQQAMQDAMSELARDDDGRHLDEVKAPLDEMASTLGRLEELQRGIETVHARLLMLALEAVQDQGIRILSESHEHVRDNRRKWLTDRGMAEEDFDGQAS